MKVTVTEKGGGMKIQGVPILETGAEREDLSDELCAQLIAQGFVIGDEVKVMVSQEPAKRHRVSGKEE